MYKLCAKCSQREHKICTRLTGIAKMHKIAAGMHLTARPDDLGGLLFLDTTL